MPRDIVFLHIPKTGGTSLRKALEEAAAGRLVLRDYGDSRKKTPKLFQMAHLDRDLSRFREHFDDESRGILLCGHFPARRYWDFFNAESFVTILRYPVDRALSTFNHFARHGKWNGTFEEFAATPRFRNPLKRLLAGVDIERFGFIGFTEELDIAMTGLGGFVGAPVPVRRDNVGKYKGGRSDIRGNAEYRALASELNAEDIALYERLKRQRAVVPRAIGPDESVAGAYWGRVTLQENGVAAGILVNRAREFIAEVEIVVDSETCVLLPADRYSQRARWEGMSRSGVCGFHLNLNSLFAEGRPYSERTFAFRARGFDYELEGSPLRWTAR